MSEIPIIKDAEMYQLLRDDRIQEFNEKKKAGSQYDLTGVDLRGLDLRGLDAEGIDFSNSYFRQADLRGLNLQSCKLDGASIHGANVSGVLFPDSLEPAEITLSLTFGTRMRVSHSR